MLACILKNLTNVQSCIPLDVLILNLYKEM